MEMRTFPICEPHTNRILWNRVLLSAGFCYDHFRSVDPTVLSFILEMFVEEEIPI